MKYLVLTGAALAGGYGSVVTPDMQGNPIFVVILAVIAVTGFAAACAWRVSRVSRD